MINPFRIDEPEEFMGRWVTHCSDCDWVDSYAHLYQSECDTIECPECGSQNVVDINEKEEE